MPTVYRIRHVPTNPYFCPSREIQVSLAGCPSWYPSGKVYVKSNLSKTGKTYLKKPSLKFIGSSYYTHLVTTWAQLDSNRNCLQPMVESEWIVEEVL